MECLSLGACARTAPPSARLIDFPGWRAIVRPSMFPGILAATTSRRRILLAGFGLVCSSVVAACTGGGRSASSQSPSAASTTTASAVTAPTPSCIVTPAETEGPYFVDEKLNRADIRVDPSDGSVRPGVPLQLRLSLASVASSCTALQGAQVDVWHCDALGLYSDVSAEQSVGKRFLRGYQTTDANGVVNFTTIYPGWYSGRAVHVHFKIRTFSGSQKTLEFTSQLFFDDSISDAVYTQSPYSTRGARDTRNAADIVYTSNNNSGAGLLADLTRIATGYQASFAIGLRLG